MKWKRLGSTKLFEHPRITLYEDEVELPSGTKTKYLHFGLENGSGMVLARNDDGKFLVQREYSYPPDEFLLQLPGGSLNINEDSKVGALREFSEETGLTGELESLGWFYSNNRRSAEKMNVFLATNLSPADGFHKDEEELFEEFWYSEDEIDTLIAENEIRNYTFLAGWSLYQAHKKTEQ